MKAALYALLFSISSLLLTFSGSAQQADEGILLTVHVLDGKRTLNDAEVLIYTQGQLLDQYNLKDRDRTITLEANGFYTLEMRSDGYHSKSININTYLPETTATQHMEFDVSLISKKEMEEPVCTVPVALIRYDNIEKKLNYDHTYSVYIQQKYPLLSER